MKTKTIILTAIVCLGMAMNLNAQSNGTSSGKTVASWEKNWYIEVGGGGQVLFSQDADRLSFSDRLTPALSFTLGRWINPYWGIRLQAQGYSMNGFVSHEHGYWTDPVMGCVDVLPDGSYPFYSRYMDVHADAQFSLANLLGGYKHARRWDVIAALGMGYLHSFKYKGMPKHDSYSGHLSMMFKYRLPKGFDLNLELQGAMMPDGFNSRDTGKPSGLVGANIGITYHFGKLMLKRKNKKQNSCENVVDEVALRQTVREELQNTEPVVVRDTVYVVKEVETVKVKEEENMKEPFTMASIRFAIGETTPIGGQSVQMVNVANYLKNNSNAKVRIEGYADAATGSAKRNRVLSMQRALEIFNILKDEYGINESQMDDVQGIGADFQPYEDDEWNRVVLIKVVR